MKYSRYNSIIENNKGEQFIINCLHDSIIQIDPKLGEIVRVNNANNLKTIHPDLFFHLKKKKMIVPKSFDEINLSIEKRQQNLTKNKILRITINPTLDCNLKCWYCYEKRISKSIMTQETLKNVVDFIRKKIENNAFEVILLSFFGGEPLMGYNKVIIPLLEAIKIICEKENIQLYHHYTTNATLLTPKRIDKLLSYSKKMGIQVAFDGGKDMHNKTKFYTNGKGCYSSMLFNVKAAIRKGVNTNVRCNVTLENARTFKDLINDLKDVSENKNLRISFQKVWQERKSTQLTTKIKGLQPLLNKVSIKSNLHNTEVRQEPCYADYENSFVINFNGDLYKCTARDFTIKNRIGFLTEGGHVFYTEEFINRIRRQYKPVCACCRILPICPICSQSKYETLENICPNQNDESAERNVIKSYYHKELHANEI